MSHGNKQQWILAKRPEGMPDSSEVILQDAPIPETGPGMLLVKNHYISLDPAIRGWMSDIPNYLPPIPLGDPVRATVVGKVLESGSDNIKAGDYVFGLGGWETHSTIPVDFCTKVPDDNPFPLHYYVNILGAVGLTPYCFRYNFFDESMCSLASPASTTDCSRPPNHRPVVQRCGTCFREDPF